jgi:hypothetical protein
MHPKQVFYGLIALIVMAGCTTLGLEPASTIEERIAYAVSQNAGLRQAAANSLDAGEITKSDAQSVLKITDEVRTALDAARTAANLGDMDTAEARLQLASAILVELQKFLRKQS